MPFVDTKPERASVLAEPVMTPSVLADPGDLTPSVLAPSVVPAGAGAEELIPVQFLYSKSAQAYNPYGAHGVLFTAYLASSFS